MLWHSSSKQRCHGVSQLACTLASFGHLLGNPPACTPLLNGPLPCTPALQSPAMQSQATLCLVAARLSCQAGGGQLFQGMSFWMGPGYKGTGVSPHQLAELLTCTGGQVLQSLPPRLAGQFCMHAFHSLFHSFIHHMVQARYLQVQPIVSG